VSSNPVEGRTKIWQLKNLILTLFGSIFRRVIYVYTGTEINGGDMFQDKISQNDEK
jgi:hypothetical protein